jgi:hypothetical protein
MEAVAAAETEAVAAAAEAVAAAEMEAVVAAETEVMAAAEMEAVAALAAAAAAYPSSPFDYYSSYLQQAFLLSAALKLQNSLTWDRIGGIQPNLP